MEVTLSAANRTFRELDQLLKGVRAGLLEPDWRPVLPRRTYEMSWLLLCKTAAAKCYVPVKLTSPGLPVGSKPVP